MKSLGRQVCSLGMELAGFTCHDKLDHILEGCGAMNPCRNAFPTNALHPMWEPHMPLCISASSSFPSSRHMHFNFTALGLLLYKVSSKNLYILALQATLSASSWSPRSSPVWRKRMMCLAQVGAWGSATRTSGISSAAGAPASFAGSIGLAGGGGPAGYEELFPVGSLAGADGSTGRGLS